MALAVLYVPHSLDGKHVVDKRPHKDEACTTCIGNLFAFRVTPYANSPRVDEFCCRPPATSASGSEAGSYLRLIDFCITQL